MSLDKAIDHGKENLIQAARQFLRDAGIMVIATGVKRIGCIHLKCKKTPLMLDWKNIGKKKTGRQYNEKIQR